MKEKVRHLLGAMCLFSSLFSFKWHFFTYEWHGKHLGAQSLVSRCHWRRGSMGSSGKYFVLYGGGLLFFSSNSFEDLLMGLIKKKKKKKCVIGLFFIPGKSLSMCFSIFSSREWDDVIFVTRNRITFRNRETAISSFWDFMFACGNKMTRQR